MCLYPVLGKISVNLSSTIPLTALSIQPHVSLYCAILQWRGCPDSSAARVLGRNSVRSRVICKVEMRQKRWIPPLLTVTNVSRSARKMETPRFPTEVSSLVSSFMGQEAILTETEAKFIFLSLFLRMSEHTAVMAALPSWALGHGYEARSWTQRFQRQPPGSPISWMEHTEQLPWRVTPSIPLALSTVSKLLTACIKSLSVQSSWRFLMHAFSWYQYVYRFNITLQQTG